MSHDDFPFLHIDFLSCFFSIPFFEDHNGCFWPWQSDVDASSAEHVCYVSLCDRICDSINDVCKTQ
jgi:hypothetical protein